MSIYRKSIAAKARLREIGQILDRNGYGKDQIILKGEDRAKITDHLLNSVRDIEAIETSLSTIKEQF